MKTVTIALSVLAGIATPGMAQQGVNLLPPLEIPKVEFELQTPQTPAWGQLETYPIFIQAPERFVQLLGAPSKGTDWFFGETSASGIEQALREAGLTNEQIIRINSEGRFIGNNTDTRVFPQADIVAAISPQGRASLYGFLARWEENYFQSNPIVIEEGTVNEWFQGTGLRQQLLDVIAAHTYRGPGGLLLFSGLFRKYRGS
ncbi:MAG: hypothetical protein ACI8UO_006749 [Verrucomicrobiales bacterium]|jgi:hypothetical protein